MQSLSAYVWGAHIEAICMFGKRVGVVGMGNIGKIIAQKWIGTFECDILAYGPYAPADAWKGFSHVRVEPLHELLRIADVVTPHVPLVESSRNLISDHELNVMKDNAILMNCARGGVVDEKVLRRALDKKKIGCATVDAMMNVMEGGEATGKLV
ncbi:hypothetical protein ZTR_05602 [Talaromyces verruculosus]|nr:hypothetical protein ZTR_05602 [Talaromyces verruculosus]